MRKWLTPPTIPLTLEKPATQQPIDRRVAAHEAIRALNEHRLKLPYETLTNHSYAIVAASELDHDAEATQWLWLLHWKPQQMVN